jgi:hypothetical protein
VVSTEVVTACRVCKFMVREMAMALGKQKIWGTVLLEVAMGSLLGAIDDNLAKAFENTSTSMVLERKSSLRSDWSDFALH